MFKSMPAHVKAVEDDEAGEGVIEALVATYDVDSIGDQIVPGAFSKSLEEWASRDQAIPFIWSHMHDDIDAYLGDVLEAKETDDGLWVKAQLDLEDEKTRKAYRLLKGGRVRNYSFAYEVIDSNAKDGGINELTELKLFEVGPTLIGMNQNTRTLVVKRDDAKRIALKVGRVLSQTNEESLREAHDAIGRVLAQLDSQPEPDGDDDEPSDEGDDTQPEEPAKRDELTSAKRDEPTPVGPVLDDLLLEVQLATYEGT